jgi:hypothetical protein
LEAELQKNSAFVWEKPDAPLIQTSANNAEILFILLNRHHRYGFLYADCFILSSQQSHNFFQASNVVCNSRLHGVPSRAKFDEHEQISLVVSDLKPVLRGKMWRSAG